jgi:hypothetical protein
VPEALVADLASNDDDNRLYFTAAVWVYVDGELSLGDQMTVFEIDNTISDDDAGTVAMITSVKIGNVANVGTEFFVHVDNGFQGEVYPIAENQWHHVALTATYDGQNQLIVWIDGERVSLAAAGAHIGLESDSFTLKMGFGLVGYLDDLQLWATAVTDDAVMRAVMQLQAEAAPNATAYFSFSESTLSSTQIGRAHV